MAPVLIGNLSSDGSPVLHLAGDMQGWICDHIRTNPNLALQDIVQILFSGTQTHIVDKTVCAYSPYSKRIDTSTLRCN